MADQSISGQLELGDAHSRTFNLSLVQGRRLNVHDEVRFPNVLHAGLVALLSDIEKSIGARIAIRKSIGAVKDEVVIVKDIHD